MAEVTREVVEKNNGLTTFVAWLALILSILALALAWTAFNRTGENLNDRVSEQVNNVLSETQQGIDETQQEIQENQNQQ